MRARGLSEMQLLRARFKRYQRHRKTLGVEIGARVDVHVGVVVVDREVKEVRLDCLRFRRTLVASIAPLAAVAIGLTCGKGG